MQQALFEPEQRQPAELMPGAWHLPDFLTLEQQNELLFLLKAWTAGKWIRPNMPDGTPMKHSIVGLGWDWVPYQYFVREGITPEFPPQLYTLARTAIAQCLGADAFPDFLPDKGASTGACIVNHYPVGSSLGMHCDRSEHQHLLQTGSPIVTISLGDSGICRQGNAESKDKPWIDFEMRSGDVWVMAGPARNNYHSFRKVLPDTAPVGLEPTNGRISLTIRQVHPFKVGVNALWEDCPATLGYILSWGPLKIMKLSRDKAEIYLVDRWIPIRELTYKP